MEGRLRTSVLDLMKWTLWSQCGLQCGLFLTAFKSSQLDGSLTLQLASLRNSMLSSMLLQSALSVTTPSWDYKPATTKDICVTVGQDLRWAFLALPEGTAPASGWPLYVHFVTDLFGPADKTKTCGSGGGGFGRVKPFTAWATPNETLTTCYPNGTVAVDVEDGSWPPHHGGNCDYDQEAGALWDQRLKQFLVSNGVAVLQLNPYETDTWDNFPEQWDGYVY